VTGVQTCALPIWPQITDLFPGNTPIERTSMNSWEDQKFVEAVEKSWTFTPAKKDGVAVEETVLVPIIFSIGKSRIEEKDSSRPTLSMHVSRPRKSGDLTWKQLASLEGTQGFAGQFVGISNGRLLLYGGTNFPDKPIWDGGAKRWYRDVYVLDEPNAKWRKVGALDDRRPSGYGVSLTTPHGIVCLGGPHAP